MFVYKKNGGLYSGTFDLSGGALHNPETLLESLKRECLEETGYKIVIGENIGCCEILNDDCYNGHLHTQHIAILYRVRLAKEEQEQIAKYVDLHTSEENDSMEAVWMGGDLLNENYISPLVKKAYDIM